MSTEAIQVYQPQSGAVEVGFGNSASFDHIQRVAKMFSASELVPQTFKGQTGLPNCIIALEMSHRMGASPLAIMQNIYIVHGKPGWSSQFIIACINTCGRFEPLRFEMAGEGDALECKAWTTDKGVRLPARKDGLPWTIQRAREAGYAPYSGPGVSIGMAKKEGWFSKNGSKWQTMPELMLHYRSATFFGRLYAPELLMGMRSIDEIIDIEAETVPTVPQRPELPSVFQSRVADAPKQPQDAPSTVSTSNPPPETPEGATEPKNASAEGQNTPSEEAIEGAMGLGPAPEAHPDPKFAPKQGDSENLAQVKLLAAKSGVTYAQLMAFLIKSGFAKDGQQLTDLAEAKLANLIKGWMSVQAKAKGM